MLLEAGHVCLGDDHCQTIENQRTAIAQLQERLNELQLAKPPGRLKIVVIPSHGYKFAIF